jgi:hypothetical protein
MKVYILVTYDSVSFSADKRVEIKGVYTSEHEAEKAVGNISLSSYEEYDIEEYTVQGD